MTGASRSDQSALVTMTSVSDPIENGGGARAVVPYALSCALFFFFRGVMCVVLAAGIGWPDVEVELRRTADGMFFLVD